MSKQLELFENDTNVFDDLGNWVAEPVTPYDLVYLEDYESHEDFEIRQALESGDLQRVKTLLDLKGSNDYM